MADPVSNEAARNRWMAIQAVRVSGVMLALLGILILRNVIAAPHWAGYVTLGVGLLDVFVAPTLLARRWRTPPE